MAYCLDDALVAGAATQIAGERLTNLVITRVRRRLFLQEGVNIHQETGRAVAALQTVIDVQGLLDGMQRTVALRQPLNCQQFTAIGLNGKHQAGTHGGAIEENCASPADAMFAADMRAGQMPFVAQHVAQQPARLYLRCALDAVDTHANLALLRRMDCMFVMYTHRFFSSPSTLWRARSLASDRARSTSTPATLRRYSAEAWMSLLGRSMDMIRAATSRNMPVSGSSPRSSSSLWASRSGVGATPTSARWASAMC